MACSATWDGGPSPAIAALVSSYRRPEFLPGLVAALEAQRLPYESYEVVLVDNGSGDRTWEALREHVARTPTRMVATLLATNRGPGGGRNVGARLVRAPFIAMTDDDCLPTEGWLAAMLEAFEAGFDVVQGRVRAETKSPELTGPWDHKIWVNFPTPFYETSNVGYRRSAFEGVGGFDESDSLTSRFGGRAFGEDAVLAYRVQANGGRAGWAEDSVVEHRWIASDYARYLADRRQMSGFPGLARRSPIVASWLWHGVFLDRQTAEFDLAVAGGVAAVLSRRPLLLGTALPWLVRRWKEARLRSGRRIRGGTPVLARLAWGDAVGLAALVKGSIKHRRLVL